MTSPMTQADQIREQLLKLQEAIHTSHPTMPVLLRQIHTVLREDPETVTILTEEEIGIIVTGLKKQTGTEITTAMVKGTKTTKTLKKMSVDDL
jgi:hypothetical protein